VPHDSVSKEQIGVLPNTQEGTIIELSGSRTTASEKPTNFQGQTVPFALTTHALGDFSQAFGFEISCDIGFYAC